MVKTPGAAAVAAAIVAAIAALAGGGGQDPNVDELIRQAQEKLRSVLPSGRGGASGIVFIFAILLVFGG